MDCFGNVKFVTCSFYYRSYFVCAICETCESLMSVDGKKTRTLESSQARSVGCVRKCYMITA